VFDAADWPTISALFDQALDLPAGEREGWVETLPESVARFKPALAALLHDHARVETNDFLQKLPDIGTADDRSASTELYDEIVPGTTIVGPYRILRLLGRGGMGTVWLAERTDGLIKRPVALKLPHFGSGDSHLAERFARERNILAGLTHPHIARLYDTGLSKGRPYLALEYVEGVPIGAYCDARESSLRDRINLFLQVVNAVQYAHSQLVVHRDLKPSNVLVAADGQVRLLDFGIAKLVIDGEAAETELTQWGGRALTPNYASPEQIAGLPIGTASDVYSLGVILYELLTGELPYRLKRDSRGALEDAILTADPAQPSAQAFSAATARARATTPKKLADALRGDLDTIVLKALKKAPEERYATAQALAEDIERYVRGEPVRAQPDRTWYRTKKLILRNKFVAASAAGAFAALAIGLGMALWQARTARAEAARADQTKNFALSIFRSAETVRGGNVATTAVDLLLNAQRRVEVELKDKPDVAVELMTAIGESLASQSKLDQAAELLRKSAALGKLRLGADDRRTLEAQAALGTVLLDSGHFDESIPLLTETVKQARRTGATDALITALVDLGASQVAAGQFEDGVANTRAAVDVVEAGGAGIDKSLAASAWLTHAYTLLQARKPGVTAAAQRALELDRAQPDWHLNGNTLSARSFYARGLANDGRLRESLAELEPLLDDAAAYYGPAHRDVAIVANALCQTRLEAGDADGAAEACLRAAEIGRQADAATPFVEAVALFNAGRAQLAGARWPQALTSFDRVLAILKAMPKSPPQMRWQAEMHRANALIHLDRVGEAERALAALEQQPLDDLERAYLRDQLSHLRSLQGRHDEAIELARLALSVLSKGANPRVHAQAQGQLGAALLEAGRPAEAIEPLRQSLVLYEARELVPSAQRTQVADELKQAEKLATAGAVSPATIQSR